MLRFREEISQLIEQENYRKAVKLAQQAEATTLVKDALKNGDHRWFAIYEDTLVIPGTQADIVLVVSPSDYWVIPGTSDAIQNMQWQSAAKQFATTYNTLLESELSKLNRGEKASEPEPLPIHDSPKIPK